MSLFSSLFNIGMARRVGLWAMLQALPDEDSLRVYLRAAYMGLAGVIIGSVLTGSAIAVGIISIYNLLIKAGWSEEAAVGVTAGGTLAIILGCFYMAGMWFSHLVNIKDELSLFKAKKFDLKENLTDAVQNVTEGFLEGLTSKQTIVPSKKATPRKIRLIS